MYSDIELKIISYIKEHLPFREKHILSTRDLSVELAKHYSVDVEKASIAALCHDLGKRYNDKEIREIIKRKDNKEYPKYITGALLHARVSSIITEEEFNITDIEIINAIESHTVGHANMTMLEKIIYTADFLEPTRKLDSADKIREYVFKDFDRAFLDVVYESISFVLYKKHYLSEKTIELYNSLVTK